jgi:hydrogenase maturation protein HypF
MGQVQGVGFRPGVYRLANQLGLYGFVCNDTRGVTIELQGGEEEISKFIVRLQGLDKPPLAQIEQVDQTDINIVEGEREFVIKASVSEGSALSQVTADIAVCRDCLAEMHDKDDFRYRYPFITCTNCGPRYSIVKSIPYDRPNTTMSSFKLCDKCSGQYQDINNRRFHAQPVACSKCGPEIWLTDSKGKTITKDTDKVLFATAKFLLDGKIVAIKGVGGFHLAADALNEQAVRRLRQRKKRDYKPFALMADSIDKIKKYAVVDKPAENMLKDPRSPIVLLPKEKDCGIAPSAAEGVDTFGFMLCYAPLHFLLFEMGLEVLVMTSGNISDEPLVCKNERALEQLSCVADVFLMHNREIYRQVDDSIVHFVDNQPVLLRRSRGYVPTPILTKKSCRQHIFTAGADLKNTFCFVKENQIICSEHIGDLENADVYHHYVNSIQHLAGLFEVRPKLAACDLHPGYLSTQHALSMPDVEVVQVQHHWAHIASVLAEHSVVSSVIGLCCDGTGYGTDGAVWGCECLIASLDSFERFGHLAYYPLAGGDRASKEAIRPIIGLLKNAYSDEFNLNEFDWLLSRIDKNENKHRIILEQIERQINCVDTSSLGRVFDAVAAMVGLGNYNNFEAQLPMALESVAANDIEQGYNFVFLTEDDKPILLDFSPAIKEIVADIKSKEPVGIISAKFHNCLAAGLFEMTKKASMVSGLRTVALSGGVFCNRYLANCLIRYLKKEGFCVLFNSRFPSNDGGISLGQAAIAANLASKGFYNKVKSY